MSDYLYYRVMKDGAVFEFVSRDEANRKFELLDNGRDGRALLLGYTYNGTDVLRGYEDVWGNRKKR